MKEKETRKYREFLVCWNDNRCVGWRTEEELNELLENKEVNWFKHKSQENKTIIDLNERDRKEK